MDDERVRILKLTGISGPVDSTEAELKPTYYFENGTLWQYD